MNPHTPYILVAYGTSIFIMLLIAVLPILRGRKLRQELRNRASVENQRHQ
ncbi:MAG: heme exporter protein CcmD [Proteobacteria bacterium]|nr:heme exporter protein CcmD [Pseudomonadota bacterium]